ncbi:MAG: PEP-CTERM sorting domain-containing protein [Armatimonadetes bacterium]|nr:PEP-CTERM sorting domain-containing protein [Armatimonadota bacterium]
MVRKSLILVIVLSAAMMLAAGSAFAYSSADLLFSVKTSDLGDSDSAISTWGTTPVFTAVNATAAVTSPKAPTVATLAATVGTGSIKWAKTAYAALGGTTPPGNTTISNSTSGFTGPLNTGIAHTGFTVVMAVRPELNTLGSNDFRSLVNIYANGMGLFIKDNGAVSLRLQTTQPTTTANGASTTYGGVGALANNTPVVMSMVVNADGSHDVWAGSTWLFGRTTAVVGWDNAMLLPSVKTLPQPYTLSNRTSIGLGSAGGTAQAGTSAFRGYLGDSYVYTTALTNAERLALVSDVEISMGMVAIPEPSSILALLMGLGSIAGLRRRKR